MHIMPLLTNYNNRELSSGAIFSGGLGVLQPTIDHQSGTFIDIIQDKVTKPWNPNIQKMPRCSIAL